VTFCVLTHNIRHDWDNDDKLDDQSTTVWAASILTQSSLSSALQHQYCHQGHSCVFIIMAVISFRYLGGSYGAIPPVMSVSKYWASLFSQIEALVSIF
jgi:hypothetical protein